MLTPIFLHTAAGSSGPSVPIVGLLLAAMAATALVYLTGTAHLWRKAGMRAMPWWRAALFLGGLALMAASISGPVDTQADSSFAVHMGQHMVLLIVAPLMLVLSEPLAPLLRGLPAPLRQLYIRARRTETSHWLSSLGTHPGFTLLFYAVALGFWHVPYFYDAALESEAVHGLEHFSFFFAGMLTWWTLLGTERHRRLPYGPSMIYVFLLMLQGSALAALFSFGTRSWYGPYADAYLGSSPLQDQQIGGVVMGVICGIAYAATAATLFLTWLQHEDRRAVGTQRRLAPAMPPPPGSSIHHGA